MFEKLFERGYGFVEAAQAARELCKNEGSTGKAEFLFEKLFTKGHGFIQAQEAIIQIRENARDWEADSLEEALKKAREEQPEEENN